MSLLGVGLVAASPTPMLGVILVLIAGQTGWTSVARTKAHPLVVGIDVLGLLVNLAVAFVVGGGVWLAVSWWNGRS